MFADERIFKIGKYLAKLRAIGWLLICFICPDFHALSCLKLQISPDNLVYDGQKLLLIVFILKAE